MKIKKGFVIEKVGDSYLACATGKAVKDFSGLIRLNETGAYMWRMLEGDGAEIEDMIAKMTAEYDVSEEVAAKDIESFIKTMKEHGIVD